MIEEAVDRMMFSLADLLGWLADNPAVVADIVLWAIGLSILFFVVVVMPAAVVYGMRQYRRIHARENVARSK